MVLSTVGGMMEKKIKLLEKRLSLVERFVEMRFSESFRDFSIRNNNLIKEDDDDHDDPLVDRVGGGKCSRRVTVKIIKNGSEDKRKSGGSCSSASRRSTRISAKKGKQKRGEVKVQEENLTVTEAKEEPLNSEGLEEGNEEMENALIEQEEVEDDGGDGYFTFPVEGGAGGNQAEETMEHEDDDIWSEDDGDKSPPKKKRVESRVQKVKRKYKPRQRIVNIGAEHLLSTKECPICHVQCKPSAYPSHVAMHGKERHLKCGFCDKRFHNKAMLFKHERIHQPEKYGKYCRVRGCGKMVFQTTRLLGHERSCIRKALENGDEVDKELMEEVRRRSQNVDLNWPGEEKEGKRRRCVLCGEEVERKEWMRHMRGHARWKCDKCGDKVAVFTEKRSLLRHYRHFHGGKGPGSSGEGEDGEGMVKVIGGVEGEKNLEN